MRGSVDEVSLLVHPALVGGTSPRSFFRASDPVSSDAVIPCRLAHVEQLRGDIVWLRYTVEGDPAVREKKLSGLRSDV